MAAALQSLSLVGAQLTVTWNDNSSNEFGFRIERSTDGNTFTTISTVASNTTTYTDASLTAGTTYWYRVRAYDQLNVSSPSNVTSGTAGAAVTSSSTPSPIIPGRIKVFTARAVAGSASTQPITVDLTVIGGSKSLLLRGVGPGLAGFTSSQTMSDPQLSLYVGSTFFASNNDWSGLSKLVTAFNEAGAYPLPVASKDSALYTTVTAQTYRQTVSGSTSGLAQAEIYDADTAAVPAAHLSKILTQATVGTGSGILASGFVVTGNTSIKLLIRAIGPGLVGVAGVLNNPNLSLYNGATLLQQNDNWGGSSTLSSAFGLVGASALSATSADSAMLVTLSPGTYTATIAGVGSTVGNARLEIYQMP